MLKSILKRVGIALSFLSVGTMASAGSLAEGLAEPEVEDLVVEDNDRGLGIWPIIGIIVVGALLVAKSNDDDDDDDAPVSKSARR